VLVTHDQEEALSLSDRVAVMDHGVIQQVDTPRGLDDRPTNALVARFVGTLNEVAGEGSEGGVRVQGVDVPARPTAEAPATGACVLAFRPEGARLAEQGIAGTIEALTYLGHTHRYRVRVGAA